MDTFYILSKTLYLLGMPLTWLLFLLIFALFSKGKKKNVFLVTTFVLLYLFSTPKLVNTAMLWWEKAPTPFSQIQQAYDVGVVLSGPVKHLKSPKDRIYINKGSDRFLHAAELYHKGLIKQILVTGGHKRAFGEMLSEAEEIKQILVFCNVPDSVITCENEARNTRENAQFSAKILADKFPNQRYLVITSAFHMRRSLACFEKVGVEVTGFSTDFYTSDKHEIGLQGFLPSATSFHTFSVLAREMLGYTVYKLMGYG